MIEYVSPKVDERADAPADDFISVLAQAERAGVFTRHQVLVNTALLLFAGHETTMNLICNGTLAFIRHPDQWERLRADPEGQHGSPPRSACATTPRSSRRSASPPRTSSGEGRRSGRATGCGGSWPPPTATRARSRIPTGSTSAASRTRTSRSAPGSTTASAPRWHGSEGQEVFHALAERFPALRLETEELSYQPSIQFRSLTSLPVAWD